MTRVNGFTIIGGVHDLVSMVYDNDELCCNCRGL